MKEILSWAPIIWTARILLLILMGGTGYIFLLFLLRFLNWKTIKGMALASPPEIESVGGEFAGAKAEVKLVAQGRQLTSIEQRVMDVEESHAALVEAVKQMRGEGGKAKRRG
ncbi:hypothetical protein [Longimicrobium sp.]|jgi:hypothetical protein|uniref:hypothetical protein n=1 Tax=Longimicrobium sp. TaxID=2029185 RepID=UPI002F94955B